MASIYQKWGFVDTPFAPTALAASRTGSQLLVGRDSELRILQSRLLNPPRLPTLEGLNGVGKTSLINVLAFRLFEKHISTGEGALIIPALSNFQLSTDYTAAYVTNLIVPEIARSLLSWRNYVLAQKIPSASDITERWLTSPDGDQVDRVIKANESDMLARLHIQTFSWLDDIYRKPADGGVVCTFDNMELLEESSGARRMFESLRDTLLIRTGLRFVLCGASGIVRSVVTSPRLNGHLYEPLEVGEMSRAVASEILPSRISAFSVGTSETYLPIGSEDFEELYSLLRGNLRATLGYVDSFCVFVAEKNYNPINPIQKREVFRSWFERELNELKNSIEGKIPPRTMSVYKKAAELGGIFSPGDYSEFGFNSSQSMRVHIKALEDLGLMSSIQDEADQRRKTISLLPKGWLGARAFGYAC